MKFWDASAIVPLLIEETTSKQTKELLLEDPEMVVWSLTPVECYSALFRRHRRQALPLEAVTSFRRKLSELEKVWNEVTQIELVKRRAERLLATHPLRAADAMQLAAALVAFSDRPENGYFVTYDEVLGRAATLEGFSVLPEGILV